MNRLNLLKLENHLGSDLLQNTDPEHLLAPAFWSSSNIILHKVRLITPSRHHYSGRNIFYFLVKGKGTITCCKCGIRGTHIIDYKLKSEQKNGGGVHHDVFCLTYQGKFQMMTVDHILPRSLGGMDGITNYRPMCTTCNGKRGRIISREDWSLINSNLDLYLSKGTIKRDKFLQYKNVIDTALLTNTTIEV